MYIRMRSPSDNQTTSIVRDKYHNKEKQVGIKPRTTGFDISALPLS